MIKTREINLNLPADKRWVALFDEYKMELSIAKKEIVSIIESIIGISYYLIAPLIKTFKLSGSIMYAEELETVATYMNISFEYALILQLCYEAYSCCTSAITKTDNEYIFFRTMDWPMEFLKSLTVELKFMKNDKCVFSCVSWVGYIGVLTALVPNKYALAVNYRRTKNVSALTMLQNVSSLANMYWPIGYLIRNICEKDCNYDSMLDYIKNAKLVSPCYITICGVKEKPLVVTRDSTSHMVHENDFVVQTNCDQNKIEPDILQSVKRRELITQVIENKQNDIQISDIKKYFCVDPVLNDETIYYAIMMPQSGILVAKLIV